LLKKVFKKYLSERIQYNLWFVLFILLVIPFLQVPIENHLFFCNSLNANAINNIKNFQNTIINQNIMSNSINDLAISINSQSLDFINFCIIFIWIIGMIFMLISTIRYLYDFYRVEKSALPLQNKEVLDIYHSCLLEMNINKKIPIYSTIFLKSPISVGIIKPRIYIPTYLITHFNKKDMRYMLLHELNHYIYKDALINCFMNIFRIVYWFNFFIWYAFDAMKIDREIACDIETLKILNEKEYIDYGYTLLHFAEKMSKSSFPYISKIGGNAKQIKKRIIHITNYKRKAHHKMVHLIIYLLVVTLSFYFIPLLSIDAKDTDHYFYSKDHMNIIHIDCAKQFDRYNGSFVLLDQSHNTWSIFNEELASLRVSPNSTYKIYDALLGLEEGIINAQNSFIDWNNEKYPFQEWERSQNLNSAMAYSVNWYFQSIDLMLGSQKIKSFLRNIGYGNKTMSQDIEMYWNDSSLKISPIEQIKLLQQFQQNTFSFSNENVQAVKDAIFITKNNTHSLYGKTGTGRVNGDDINGWFIGYVETNDNTYYFATNIQSDSEATGHQAAEISLSILADLGIWK